MNRSTGPLRIVTDTNLIISAEIVPGSAPALVLDAWRQNRYELVTSAALVAEVANVVARPAMQRYHFDPQRINSLLAALRARVRPALPEELLPIHCRDPKDDKVLAAALGATADYIVTGDNDLLALDGDPALPGLRIVTPARFLDLLGQVEAQH